MIQFLWIFVHDVRGGWVPSVCPSIRPSFQMDIWFSCLASFVEHTVFSPLNCLCIIVEILLNKCVGPCLDSILFHQTDVYSFSNDAMSLFLWLSLLILSISFHAYSLLFLPSLQSLSKLRSLLLVSWSLINRWRERIQVQIEKLSLMSKMVSILTPNCSLKDECTFQLPLVPDIPASVSSSILHIRLLVLHLSFYTSFCT